MAGDWGGVLLAWREVVEIFRCKEAGVIERSVSPLRVVLEILPSVGLEDRFGIAGDNRGDFVSSVGGGLAETN